MEIPPTTMITDTAVDGPIDPALPRLLLVLAWSRDEPARLGEVLIPPSVDPGTSFLVGREPSALEFYRQRPGESLPNGVSNSPRMSRQQLRLEPAGPDGLLVTNLGRRPMRHNGVLKERAAIAPGDTLEIDRALLFFAVARPPLYPKQRYSEGLAAFGDLDRNGIVGESPAVWRVRDDIAFCAGRSAHVLVLGESGTGKELAAQAIHRCSSRHHNKLVSRNCMTLPEGIVEAELFGNLKDYPNPGMPDRPGLVGEARGSTLFLDEIGELPESIQARLLRVLDEGEYTRLGESRASRADLRLVCATNRPASALKHDLLARLKLRIVMPGLNERREDIPLLVRHLLRKLLSHDPDIQKRLCPDDPEGLPSLSPRLVDTLVRHTYTTHVRELEGFLWAAMRESRDGTLDVPESLRSDDSVSLARASFATSAGSEAAHTPAALERSSEPAGRTASPIPAVPPTPPFSTLGETSSIPPAPVTSSPSGELEAPHTPDADESACGSAERETYRAPTDPEWLSEEEQRLIARQRALGFSATRCAREKDYPGTRTTADFQLRRWVAQALCRAQWDVDLASRLLAGDSSPALEATARKRITSLIVALGKARADKGKEGIREYLYGQYRKQSVFFLRLVDAMEAGRLTVDED